MLRTPRALCAVALGAVLLAATPAAAGLVTEPLGLAPGQPVTLHVVQTATTLTVTAQNSVALTHNDAVNCSGGGTTQVVCTLTGASEVLGASGDDVITVALDGADDAHPLTVKGRRGDDLVEVVQADGGLLYAYGNRDVDILRMGAPASRLAVAPDTRIYLYNGGRSVDPGAYFDVHVDTEGFIFMQGNGGVDTFDISGTITRTANWDAAIDVRGLAGDDVFLLEVDHIETELAGTSRAVLYLDGGDGSDVFGLATDMTIIGGVFEVHGAAGNDTFDFDGHALTMLSDGDYTPSTETVVRLHGEQGTDGVLDDTGDHIIGDTGEHDPVVVFDVAW